MPRISSLKRNGQGPIKSGIALKPGAYQLYYSDPIALQTHAQRGLNADAAFDFLGISGFSNEEFQEIFNTTVKTIQNYQVQKRKLDPTLSEKLLKSFSLFDKGIELFGSSKSFHDWLNQASYGLGSQTPIVLMNTITGINLIEEELIRMEFGDLA